MEIQILFEDQDILVCYKPAGIPTQTKKIGSKDMVSVLKNRLYQKKPGKGEPYLAVIHRLDQPVEGILVFGKNQNAARELNKSMNQNDFGKYYKTVVCGIPKERTGKLEDYLVKDAKTNTSSVCTKAVKDAKKAILEYEVIGVKEEKNLSQLKVKLETGRHHQIRVQMANMGCPIWGDTKYNSQEIGEPGWKHIALCAYHLEFKHPKTKKKMIFEIEPQGEIFWS